MRNLILRNSPFMDNNDLWDLMDKRVPQQMDMYEEEDKVIVKFVVPGYKKEDIDISLEGNTLTITGKVESNREEENGKKYYVREISSESFTRSVNIPFKVNTELVDAKFEGGILELTLPKSEEAKPKKIQIKA